MNIEIGKTYEVMYPFYIKNSYVGMSEDGPEFADSWIPGTFTRPIYPDDCDSVANDMGLMRLRVVSIHDPGRPYHARIFYVRTWLAPSGKSFGDTKLRIASKQKFKRLLHGYSHDYTIISSAEAPAE